MSACQNTNTCGQTNKTLHALLLLMRDIMHFNAHSRTKSDMQLTIKPLHTVRPLLLLITGAILALTSYSTPADSQQNREDAASYIRYKIIKGPPQQYQWKELDAINNHRSRKIRLTYNVHLLCGTQVFDDTKTISLEPGRSKMISHWEIAKCFDAQAQTKGAYFLN